MNTEQLNAIKERAAKATPGNWHVTLDDPYDRTYVLGAFNNEVSVIADIKGDADAEFIANAREDVPALVAEVERLQQENESLKRSLQYIVERRENNRDWTVAHNALAVYGRPKGAY